MYIKRHTGELPEGKNQVRKMLQVSIQIKVIHTGVWYMKILNLFFLVKHLPGNYQLLADFI